ncbi:MAG: hypothetical protein ACRYF1_17820 [Janthinobacterium lividum]
MELGKMLAEAIAAYQAGDADGFLETSNPKRADLDGTFDLTAAAEAFLAKVREADQAETDENNPPAALYGNVE